MTKVDSCGSVYRVKTVQPGMNLNRQLRKLEAQATTPARAIYVAYVKGLLLASAAMGIPQPASHFIPMIFEEFDDCS